MRERNEHQPGCGGHHEARARTAFVLADQGDARECQEHQHRTDQPAEDVTCVAKVCRRIAGANAMSILRRLNGVQCATDAIRSSDHDSVPAHVHVH